MTRKIFCTLCEAFIDVTGISPVQVNTPGHHREIYLTPDRRAHIAGTEPKPKPETKPETGQTDFDLNELLQISQDKAFNKKFLK